MISSTARSCAALVLALSLSTVLEAQAIEAPGHAEPRRRAIANLYKEQGEVRAFWQTALSPDGQKVAWAVEKADGAGEEVYAANLNERQKSARVTANAERKNCWEHDPVWSKDGGQLAFLSDCATPGQAQLFVQSFGSALTQPRQITHLTGYLSHPRWAPDGASIALLFVDHASRRPSAMAAENKAVGVIDDLQNTDVQRLTIANVESGATTEITPQDLYVFEYDWSPDGRSFAYTGAAPPGDDNWYIARLFAQHCCVPTTPAKIYKPHLQIAVPRWSPDGKFIAFIEGLMSDEGGTGGEIHTIPAAGGKLSDLTPGRQSTPSWFAWLSNTEMLFTEFDGGSVAINKLNVETQRTTMMWKGDESLRAGPEETSLSLAEGSASVKASLIRMSWSMLPEVWAGPIGRWDKITSVNDKVRLPLPKFDNIAWNHDGYQIQGWLLYPSNYDPQRKYPLLTAVHGGPAWIAQPEWRSPDFNTTLFTDFGYFVFFPNARGSYGRGEKFTQANRRDWGFGDLQDMISGIDEIEKKYPVDNNRIGILGWSYGGSTAMMAVTQTNRFHAAVAGAGAANWQSYYGQNSIDKWMIPYFGASVYDDPKAYARCSAMTYIKNAKTPTLVLVGERDGEAPPAQSFEFWHALKELGVPTKLVIYAGEGHSFNKITDEIDVTVRTLDWFDRYLPEQP